MIYPNTKKTFSETLTEVNEIINSLRSDRGELIIRFDFLLNKIAVFTSGTVYEKAQEIYPQYFTGKSNFGQTVYFYFYNATNYE